MSSPDYKSATKTFFKKNLVDKVVSANKLIKKGVLDSWKCYVKDALELSNKLSIFDNLCATDDTEEFINPAYINTTITPEGDPSSTVVECTTIPLNPPDISFIFNTVRNLKITQTPTYNFIANVTDTASSQLYWRFISPPDVNGIGVEIEDGSNGMNGFPDNVLNGVEQPVKLKSRLDDFTKISEVYINDVHGVGEVDTTLLTNLRKIEMKNTKKTVDDEEQERVERNRFEKLVVGDWVNNDGIRIEWSGNALNNGLIEQFLTDLKIAVGTSINTDRIVGLFDQFSDAGAVIGEGDGVTIGDDTTLGLVQYLEINHNMKIEIRKFSLRCEFNRNDNAYN
jgi:hypothetical protein